MINLGLSRISAVVAHLPTRRTWKAVHIAGTNGKGSVAAYLSSLFLRLSTPVVANTELKIGRFTSPHLIDRWDCITINNQPVSESLFLQVEREVQAHATRATAELSKTSPQEDNQVSEFELLTATAFEIFSQQNCQVAIIECGLGGRLDATNVLNDGDGDGDGDVACSAITKIGLDHMGLLGDTVEEIAREKAGIAKRRVPLVVDGTNSPTIVDAVRAVARSKDSPVLTSTLPPASSPLSDALRPLPQHQQHNLLLALTVFTTAQPRLANTLTFQPFTPADHLPRLLADVRASYPARLQHLSVAPLLPPSLPYRRPVLLDGAHNPQSARVLHTYVSSSSPARPLVFILALSRGKSTTDILEVLLLRRRGDRDRDRDSPPRPTTHVVATRFGPVDGMPWVAAQDPDDVAAAAARFVGPENVAVAGDAVAALEVAVRICRGYGAGAGVGLGATGGKEEEEGVSEQSGGEADAAEFEIVVAGSLYLASDLLRALRRVQAAGDGGLDL